MAVNNSKPAVRRRVHKGRVGGCLTVLVILIFTVSTIISGCTKKNAGNKEKPVINDVSVSQESVTDVSQDTVKKYIICIDPGHGGEDIGSSNGDRLEKVDNLRYATEVIEEFSRRDIEGIEFEIVTTRTSNDVDMSNKERAAFGNNAGADLYLALHRNHSTDRTANGVEIWVQQQAEVIDEVLGYKLFKYINKVGIQSDRGLQKGYTNDTQNNFQIIEYTNMPCCIVELGFISNDEDNRLFDEHYKEYGKAIVDAVVELCQEGYLDKVQD